MRTITRNHILAGCIAPKTIENGVIVPPALQINGLLRGRLHADAGMFAEVG